MGLGTRFIFGVVFWSLTTSTCWAVDGVDPKAGAGGESLLDPENGSIPPAEREFAKQLIDLFVDTFGPLSMSVPGVDPPAFQFFPMGGNLWDDLLTINFVDLDPGPGLLDWDCQGRTVDGHTGNDTIIRSFAEQDVGVSVFAIADGVVVAVHDGEPDQNVIASGMPSNFVIIDHGSGREVWYWHLRSNSITVFVGETVFAGEQIAEVGSSGNSEAPHLHLEVHVDGAVVEPYAGPCNPRASMWRKQVPIRRETYLQDFGLTTDALSSMADWPMRWPATGNIGFADPPLKVWFLGANLPAESTWTVRFRRPDGSLVPFAQPQSFGNAVPWRRFHWWWTYDVSEMHSTSGTWNVLLYINDKLMVEAPLDVMAERDPALNRPPFPVAVRFDPPEPLPGDVVGCVIDTPAVLDDPDYDVVRYEYVWLVNDDVVRRVTTAGHADYLSSSLFGEQDLLTCVVTPTDGQDNANASATAIPAVQPAVPAVGPWALVMTALLILTSATLVIRRPGVCACA